MKTDKSASKAEHGSPSDNVCAFHVAKRHHQTGEVHVKGRAGTGLFLPRRACEAAWHLDKIQPVQTASLGEQALNPLFTAPCKSAALMMCSCAFHRDESVSPFGTRSPEMSGLSTPSVTSQRAHLQKYFCKLFLHKKLHQCVKCSYPCTLCTL